MLSDQFDNKIKEIMNEPQGSFEEASWQKMEKLLDKHLPQQKDDRRRIFFLLFFFLLLGSGAVLWISGVFSSGTKHFVASTPTSSHKANEIANTSKTKQIPAANRLSTQAQQELTAIEKTVKTKPDAPGKKSWENQTSSLLRSSERKSTVIISKKKTFIQPSSPLHSEKPSGQPAPDNHAVIRLQQTDKQKDLPAVNETAPSGQMQNSAIQADNPSPAPAVNKPAEHDEPYATAKKQNNRKSFASHFFITLSAGPDISAVGFRNAGKVKLNFGAGIGYRFSQRWSLRSGLYAGRKVYTAAPGDYHPPAVFWNYYPNLKSIDANCNVLEWPLSLDYHVAHHQAFSGFVSAGLSSLFMKKETYDYYYKPNNSPQFINYSRTYKNINKHYFAVLNLSGTLAKKISPAMTLQAEPYVKMALSGVGYGKVKLNSSGILFSVMLQPFNGATKNKHRISEGNQ
jgi:hypothetical protein